MLHDWLTTFQLSGLTAMLHDWLTTFQLSGLTAMLHDWLTTFQLSGPVITGNVVLVAQGTDG